MTLNRSRPPRDHNRLPMRQEITFRLRSLFLSVSLAGVALALFVSGKRQGDLRLQLFEHQAFTWTSADAKRFSDEEFVDRLLENPEASIGSVWNNLLSPITHVDVHNCVSDAKILDVIGRGIRIDSVQLCHTLLDDEDLSQFANDHRHCYITGFNNGIGVECNAAAKMPLPWAYE